MSKSKLSPKNLKNAALSQQKCRIDWYWWRFIVSYDSANKQKHHESHRMQ